MTPTEPIEVATDFAGRFTSAWNHHDMSELGQLFHGDASAARRSVLRLRGPGPTLG